MSALYGTVHTTRAKLSCDMQKLGAISSLEPEWKQNKNSEIS